MKRFVCIEKPKNYGIYVDDFTIGKFYYEPDNFPYVPTQDLFILRNNNGMITWVWRKYFSPLSKIRKKKLEKLYEYGR